jgi:hypothetical protein
MSTGHMILTAIWLMAAAFIAIVGLLYPQRLQAWNVRRLEKGWERHIIPSFVRRVAASRYALWQMRLVGLVALGMFLLAIYILLFGDPCVP